jgi:hypothetical protein
MRRWLWRALKGLGLLIAIVLLAGGAFVALKWRHVSRFPSILPAFYAKEHCSCLFVLERDDAFCRNYARQFIAIDELEVDRAAKRVRVEGTWRRASARFYGRRAGCRLE